MAISTQRLTVEAFDAFAALPENDDKTLEFIGGDVVEVPSNPFASAIASNISFFITLFLRESGIEGHVTGEAGGYAVSGERYAPDVGYIAKARQAELARAGYNPNPPDLAVEVDFSSTTTSQRNLRIKIANYLAAGVVVWVVYPETKEVEVYAPGQKVRIFTEADTLDGGTVLPGFRLAVRDAFGAGAE